jgi:hypothetical protein
MYTLAARSLLLLELSELVERIPQFFIQGVYVQVGDQEEVKGHESMMKFRGDVLG